MDTREQKYYDALYTITKFMTPEQIRRDAKKVGLGYEEYLEMAYENVLANAKQTIRGKRRPK